MQIVFIRHGEPDYSYVIEKGFVGHGIDMAQLTDKGVSQAIEASHDVRLCGAEIILSSPYTRALQTAAIISRYRNIELRVEMDLHEWIPSHTYASINEKSEIFKLFAMNKGTCPDESDVRYEEYQSVFDRVNACLKKYMSYKKIIVVAHALVISAFCYPTDVQWGGIAEFEFADNLRWRGWE